MEPLVRQTALETLLKHYQELKPKQLSEALKLGLTDPDLQISEKAWDFVQFHEKTGEFKKEIKGFVKRLKKEGDAYSLGLVKRILKKLLE